MRVLVTGATGFLGRHLVTACRQRGHIVRAVHRPASDPSFPDDVELVELDLRRPVGLDEALEGVDVVIHAAAVKEGDFHDQFAGTVATTQHLLDAMERAGVDKLVLVSSFSVYDQQRVRSGHALDEETPLADAADARDAYSATKLLQEELVDARARELGWSVMIARPGAIYGRDNLWFTRLGYRVGRRAWVGVGRAAAVPAAYAENAADALAFLAERVVPGVDRVNVIDDEPPSVDRYRRQLAARIGLPRREVILPWSLVHGLIAALDWMNRLLGHPLKLPGALRLDAAVARWKPLRYPNTRLRALGWQQPVPWPETLDRAVAAPGERHAPGATR